MRPLILFIILGCISFTSAGWANEPQNEEDFLDFGTTNFDFEKSYWLVDFAGQYIKSKSENFLPYNGTYKEMNNELDTENYGPSLSLGRNFYLGGGFSFSLKAAGFYNLRVAESKANPKVDQDIASVKKKSEMSGYEGVVSINYRFKTSLAWLEPFIEFGVGRSLAKNTYKYNFDGIIGDGSDRELYDITVQEEMMTNRLGIGLNIISARGLASYLKFSALNTTVEEVGIKGEIKEASGSLTAVKSKESGLSQTNQALVVSLGMSYFFH